MALTVNAANRQVTLHSKRVRDTYGRDAGVCDGRDAGVCDGVAVSITAPKKSRHSDHEKENAEPSPSEFGAAKQRFDDDDDVSVLESFLEVFCAT